MDKTHPQHQGVTNNEGQEHRDANLWIFTKLGGVISTKLQLLNELWIPQENRNLKE